MLLAKSNFSPNRNTRYDSMIFHHSNVALNTKNSKLNTMPGTLAVRGGGNSTYRTDVIKNHATVGSSVYDQAIPIVLNDPRAPSTRPAAHMLMADTSTPLAEPIDNSKNCRVSRNGRNAATFTTLASAK